MTNQEGASDTLVAIKDRLDRMAIRFGVMETGFDAMYQTLQLQGAMLRVHGDHFGRLEAKLVEHGNMLKAHDARFDRVDATLAEHGRRFDRIDNRFDRIDARFGQIDARFGQIDDRFGQVDEMLGKILARLDAPRP
jgi:hypothetical protein